MKNKRFTVKLKNNKDIELFLRKVLPLYYRELNLRTLMNDANYITIQTTRALGILNDMRNNGKIVYHGCLDGQIKFFYRDEVFTFTGINQ